MSLVHNYDNKNGKSFRKMNYCDNNTKFFITIKVKINNFRMRGHNDEKVNQVRHMILTIAGKSCEIKSDIDLTKLLRILVRNSEGSIKTIAKKLLRDKNSYLTTSCWMFTICRQLSLDHEENLSIIT